MLSTSEVAQPTPSTDATVTVERGALDALLAAIARQGYQVGSTVHEGAVVDGNVRSSPDLPGGWGDEQAAAPIACGAATMKR